MDATPAAPRALTARRFFSRTALEYGIAVVLCLTLSFVIMHDKFAKPYEFQGDTAMYYQSVHAITKRGVPFTSVGEGSIWLHQYRPFRLSAAELARDPLPPSPVPEANILVWHSYFVLYPIALLTLFLPTPGVLVAIYVLSFTGALLFAYFLIRRSGVPLLPALLYCLLLVTYPAWSQGLSGQFYPDRIFVLAGLLFMYAVSTKRSPIWLQVALAVLCASITERGALIAGIATLAYLGLSWRSTEQRYFRLGLGIALLAVSFVEFHSLINNENGAYLARSVGQFLKWCSRPAFAHALLFYVLVNLPLLVLAFFDRRGAAVAVLLMLPNVFGTIDLSEKIGWTTSYHSYYMPALILASARGFSMAYTRAAGTRNRSLLLIGTGALALFLAALDPFSYNPIDLRAANIASSFVPQLIAQVRHLPDARVDYAADDAAIRNAVPVDARITAVESAMPILFQNRNIQFYPLGMDSADYAVLSMTTEADGTPYLFGGFRSYRGPADQKLADAVLLARLRKDGYDVDHPLVFTETGYVVLKHSKTTLRDL